MEGRHVGLDFYDLLIEVQCDNCSDMQMNLPSSPQIGCPGTSRRPWNDCSESLPDRGRVVHPSESSRVRFRKNCGASPR